MSFLDALGGVGSLFSSPKTYQPFESFSLQQQICIHPNCQICSLKTALQQKAYMEQADLIAKKKTDYEKRCKEYMDKFREKYRRKI